MIFLVLFLRSKDEAFEKFSTLCKKNPKLKGNKLVAIRSDHIKEFDNKDFKSFCNENGICHNFSAPRTPQ